MPDDRLTPSRRELHSMLILLGQSVGDLRKDLKAMKDTLEELEGRLRQLEYNFEDEQERRREREDAS